MFYLHNVSVICSANCLCVVIRRLQVCIDQCPTEPYSVLHAVSGVNVEFNVADAKEKFICKYHVDISGSNSIDVSYRHLCVPVTCTYQ